MRKFLLLFFLSLGIYLMHFWITGQGIYGDGNGYYSYAHALYFERRLDFTPIYNHLSNFQGRHGTINRVGWNTEQTMTGLRNNLWTVGTGLFWIPSLALIHTTSMLLGTPISKFSSLYELGPGVTGIILGILGLYFSEKYLKLFFEKKVSELVIVTLFFTTNFFYRV